MISKQTKNELRAIIDRLETSPEREEQLVRAVLFVLMACAIVPGDLNALTEELRGFSKRRIADLKERIGR
jgi:hypothetical protein